MISDKTWRKSCACCVAISKSSCICSFSFAYTSFLKSYLFYCDVDDELLMDNPVIQVDYRTVFTVIPLHHIPFLPLKMIKANTYQHFEWSTNSDNNVWNIYSSLKNRSFSGVRGRDRVVRGAELFVFVLENQPRLTFISIMWCIVPVSASSDDKAPQHFLCQDKDVSCVIQMVSLSPRENTNVVTKVTRQCISWWSGLIELHHIL